MGSLESSNEIRSNFVVIKDIIFISESFFLPKHGYNKQNNQNLFATTLQRHKYTSTYETYGTAL